MSDENWPKYDLNDIKSAFDVVDKLRMTSTAMQGQYDLNFSDEDVVNAIQALSESDFYKSMPPLHQNFSA